MASYQHLVDHPRMPRVGQLIADRYQVLSVVGEGGFGAVYRVRDNKTEAEVAVKVLDPFKSAELNFAQRFKQEIKHTSQLKHPNSIKVWDAGETSTGCLFMTMELVSGEPLNHVIHETGKLSVSRTLHITSQILKSLAEAHRLGIIHRDLKPANIMLCQLEADPDFVKVLDFGISKALSPDLASVKTQTGMFLGTPRYAAPEVLRGVAITPAADLYSLGLMVYEMLTGESAIKAESMVAIITEQVKPHPVEAPPEFVGTPLGRLLERATAKSLDERYQTALEMLADIRAIEEGERSAKMIVSAPGVSSTDETKIAPVDEVVESRWHSTIRWVDEAVSRHRIVIPLVLALTVFALVAVILTGTVLKRGEPAQTSGSIVSTANGEEGGAAALAGTDRAVPPDIAEVGTLERGVGLDRSPITGSGVATDKPTTGVDTAPGIQPMISPIDKPALLLQSTAAGPPGQPSAEDRAVGESEPNGHDQSAASLSREPGDTRVQSDTSASSQAEATFEAGDHRSIDAHDEDQEDRDEAGETEDSESHEAGSAGEREREDESSVATATVRLRVDSEPEGADVWLDGTSLGETPLDEAVPMSADTVRLEVRYQGHRTWRRDIRLDESELAFTAHLRPRSSEPSASSVETSGDEAEVESNRASDDTQASPVELAPETVETQEVYDPFGLIQNQ